MRDETEQRLADDLVGQYGNRLPDGLIRTTVAAAGRLAPADDEAERIARTDVALLADAASRAPEAAAP